ncbi:MAG: DUF2304 domain-containing protein [Planctomycetes bacterium]|nr:DUF2304 domain-containing protein [Planctomycetota bacterium]
MTGIGALPSALANLAELAADEQNRALLARQRVVAFVLALAMLVVVLELVRRRKLREEYTLLWTGTALGLIVLAWHDSLLDAFAGLVGAAASTSALFFGAIVFLMLVSLQFSVRLSKLTFRNRMLSQRVALLERELTDLRERQDRHLRTHRDEPPADGPHDPPKAD